MSDINLTFDKEKSLNAVLFIAQHLKRKDIHKIFKILYFADRESLCSYGNAITGDIYIAMGHGPVPSRIYDMFKIVRGDSYMSDVDHLERAFSITDWMYLTPKREADLTKLSPVDQKILSDCISKYGGMTYDEITEKSHDIAWRSTARDYPINVESIIREAGMDEQALDYVKQYNDLKKMFN